MGEGKRGISGGGIVSMESVGMAGKQQSRRGLGERPERHGRGERGKEGDVQGVGEKLKGE